MRMRFVRVRRDPMLENSAATASFCASFGLIRSDFVVHARGPDRAKRKQEQLSLSLSLCCVEPTFILKTVDKISFGLWPYYS